MPSDINQRLGFEAAGAIKTLRSLAKALGQAATGMKAFVGAARVANGSFAGLDASLKGLSTQITALSTSVNKLGPVLRQMAKKAQTASGIFSKFASTLKFVALTADRKSVV